MEKHNVVFAFRHVHSALWFIYDEAWTRLSNDGVLTTWENVDEPGNDWRIEE